MFSLQPTLFYFLTNSFTLWPEAYSCEESLVIPGTRWPGYGIYLVVSESIFLSLYLPCYIEILKSKSRTPTYRLMLILGSLDLTGLVISSLIPGYFVFYGISFCQQPIFFFITGTLVVSSWVSSCFASIIMAMDRCAEVDPQFPLAFLVRGCTFKCVIFLLLIYGSCALLITQPCFFSTQYLCYLFNPMLGKNPDMYQNYMVVVNNTTATILTTGMYFHLCYYLIFKFGYSTSMWLYKSKRQTGHNFEFEKYYSKTLITALPDFNPKIKKHHLLKIFPLLLPRTSFFSELTNILVMPSLQLSLFYFLTNSFTLWPEAYSCNESMRLPGPKWPVYGIYLVVSGTFLLSLYLPCYIAILKSKSRKSPTYRLMLILGSLDLTALFINSILAGYYAFNGISFCQLPIFMFTTGAVTVGLWVSGCFASILMAMDRCAEVNPQFPLALLFRGRTFNYVIFLLFIYGMYAFLFTQPVIFSTQYHSYLYDPMIGNNPKIYLNYTTVVNNTLSTVLTTGMYFHLCYYLIFKFGYSTSMWLYKSKRQIIAQGIILTFFHASTSIIYEYVQFFPAPWWLILIAHISWQFSSGCLGIVYLTLNRTIRNSVVKMIFPKKMRLYFGWYIGTDEHVALEQAGNTLKTAGNAVGVGINFDSYFQN